MKCFCGHRELSGFHDEKICVDLSNGIRIVTHNYQYNQDYKLVFVSPEVWDSFSFWYQDIHEEILSRDIATQVDELEKWLEAKYA